MILHRCLGSMSESIVLAIGPLSDKGEAEGYAGVLPIMCSSSAPWGGQVDAGQPPHHHPAGDDPRRGH
jgi:hypothetical protein